MVFQRIRVVQSCVAPETQHKLVLGILFVTPGSQKLQNFRETRFQSEKQRLTVAIDSPNKRKTKKTNQLLFYIFDDGTVEKKLIIE